MDIAFGECHCGCGGKTAIATQNHKSGTVKGHPSQFLRGHQARSIRPSVIQPSNPAFRNIPLTRGQWATVNVEDCVWLIRWNWYAVYDPKMGMYYAERSRMVEDGPGSKGIKMHAVIVNPRPGYIADHRSGDTLDNRRLNLREAMPEENARNCKVRSTSTTGVTGVTWDESRQRYYSHITIDGKMKNLGRFKKEDFDIAVAVRKNAEQEHFGEFARNGNRLGGLPKTSCVQAS